MFNPCCCGPCQYPDEIEVDLGAGGWTNEDCNGCENVAGVFVLTKEYENIIPDFSCDHRYEYTDCRWCDVDCSGNVLYAKLFIKVEIFTKLFTSPVKYNIKLTVEISINLNEPEQECPSVTEDDSVITSQAIYEEIDLLGYLTNTLDRTSNGHGVAASVCVGVQNCDGDLPLTADVYFP